MPTRCAGCKALRWWKAPRVKKQPSASPRQRGKPRKYPIDKLRIREAILIEFYKLENGWPDVKRNNVIHCSILNYSRRSGKTFKREVFPHGILVTRET